MKDKLLQSEYMIYNFARVMINEKCNCCGVIIFNITMKFVS